MTDLRTLIDQADQHLLASDYKWMLWIRHDIVLLRPTGQWSVEDATVYVNLFWNIFNDLRKTWPSVFYVIDMNQMDIQTEEFRRYLKENWTHLLERQDLRLCFVEGKSMKRLIWNSIFQLIGRRHQLFLFKDFAEAFAWIDGPRARPAGRLTEGSDG